VVHQTARVGRDPGRRAGGRIRGRPPPAALAWEHLGAQIDLWLGESRPSYLQTHLSPLGEPLAALLHAAATLDATDLRDQVVADIRHRREEAVPLYELTALRTAATLPAGLRQDAGFPEVADDCAARMRTRLSHPARADDDWSLTLPGGCTCDLCAELGSFLRDPRRNTLDWPLAEQRRRHVHDRIQGAELPVTHQTRRRGRPYVLVLTKNPALFEQERTARTQDQADLDWLTATWDVPADQ
jgi:hypothetical protein